MRGRGSILGLFSFLDRKFIDSAQKERWWMRQVSNDWVSNASADRFKFLEEPGD